MSDNKIEFLTGTAIPVGALKTADSCGVGEFLDLIPFADFCKKAGLKLIQLLPVNDTGTESSPYSALSAFALHPLYISLKSLPEVEGKEELLKEITKLQKKYEKLPRFQYRELRRKKLELLQKIFESEKEKIISSSELSKWIKNNPWIQVYSIFMQKKEKKHEASWKEWGEPQPTKKELDDLWKDKKNQDGNLFYAWVQMRLDEQFAKASKYAQSLGIKLKGDIPIMMNEDSCDAWAFPEYFNDEMRAGSPPDGPNPVGQNWGFPIYNWDNLKKDDYSWWKNRLIQASKYYQVYRIDHVLGFFRIWATPQRESTAMLGWTQPFEPITTDELHNLGFSDDRITWLSVPHVPTNQIEAVNNGDYLGTHGILAKIMDRIGNEEMWRFKPEIKGEKDIWASDIPDNVKPRLAEFWRNRALVKVADGLYSPLWTYHSTTAWQSLSDDEKYRLGQLIVTKYSRMEVLWEEQARTLLGDLTSCTDMVACAEDLGSNPESLPRVLNDLSILSLRVVRWSRNWNAPGEPYYQFGEYPYLSVTTSSVHDSSTARLWWLKEGDAWDFYRTFPGDSDVQPGSYNSKTARYLLSKMAESNSAFCIHPLQDFLGLVEDYFDENPDNERVNIPGSVNEFNWTYRLPVTIEKLIKNKELISEINNIVKIHER
ncbi:MAG: 4-alpha-glucanotransferase [Spirochaetaceae bacterium]|nr:4-alpha-glucanotransferase [Spirochaetaceae bacterium]MBQ7905761.1 4-alpha-glucanotransferase [Spirochaetaceae bacterium]